MSATSCARVTCGIEPADDQLQLAVVQGVDQFEFRKPHPLDPCVKPLRESGRQPALDALDR